MKPTKRILISGTLVVGLAAAGYWTWLLFQGVNNFFTIGAIGGVTGNIECAHIKTVRVDGDSMEPVLKADSEIEIYEGYYNCNDIKRGDIAVYSYSQNRPAVVKFIAGVPGDNLRLQADDDGFTLYINNQPAVTATGESYLFNDSRAAILRLYIDNYNGIIPADTYLLLGNKPGGSFDSSQFGLVGKNGFEGKVR